MSDEPILRVRSRSSIRSGSGRALIWPIAFLGAGIWVLALAEIGQAWEEGRLSDGYNPPAHTGDLVSVTMENGQEFFGTLDSISRTTIGLRDVFYAQLAQQNAHGDDQQTQPAQLTILRRRDSEWTQSDLMAIPVDRINYMETIGVDSRMAHYITNARSRPVLPSMPAPNQAPEPSKSDQPPKG